VPKTDAARSFWTTAETTVQPQIPFAVPLHLDFNQRATADGRSLPQGAGMPLPACSYTYDFD